MTWLTWIAAHPDAELFAVGDGNGRLRLWSPGENRVVAKHELGSRVRNAAWTHDGRRLVAIGSDDKLHVFSGDGTTVERTIATGHPRVAGLSVHPSRPLAATTGNDCHVRVWDLESGQTILDVKEPSVGTTTALSEKHVAAGFASGHFVAWLLETGKDLAGGEIFPGEVSAMAFSHDGESLVCGGVRGSLIMIESSSWRCGEVWKGTPPKPIATNSIAFDERGRFLCAHSDDTVSLFAGVRTRVPSTLGFAFYVDRKPWKDDYIVSCACFVPNTPLVLTTHFTGHLRIWSETALVMKVGTVTFDPESDLPAIVAHLGESTADPIAWWRAQAPRRSTERETAPAEPVAEPERPSNIRSAPPVDVTLRRSAISELAAGAVRAADLPSLGRAAALVTTNAGITMRTKDGGMVVDFAPPIATTALAKLLGWSVDAFRDPSARPRIGTWVVTVPHGGRAGDDITQLRLELGATATTRYVKGSDPWRASSPPASKSPLTPMLQRLFASDTPPQTVGALEAVLGFAIDDAGLAASSMGRVALAPKSSIVMNVSARYVWHPHAEVAVTKLDDLRARSLVEWSAAFSEGFDALATELEKRLGKAEMRNGRRVHGAFVVDGSTGRACTLAWFSKPPEWTTVPMPTPTLGRSGE